MKRWILIILGVFGILGVVGFIMVNRPADLRTAEMKKGVTKEAEAKGRALLLESIKTLGGVKKWEQYKKNLVKVTMKDVWKDSFMTRMIIPKNLSGHKMELLFHPNLENIRLNFLEGKRKGTSWGIQQWSTYKTNKAQKVTWKNDSNIKFYLPTYQYFMYMPFYLTEAQLITYAGERKLHGRSYDLVFATWGKYEPNKKMDQYLIWINKQNKQIDYVQFTVRDIMPMVVSTGKATDYKDVEGLKLPHKWTIIGNLKKQKDWIHVMEFSFSKPAKPIQASYLVPDPKRVAKK